MPGDSSNTPSVFDVLPELPKETRRQIWVEVFPSLASRSVNRQPLLGVSAARDPSVPPANGSCPFMDILTFEERRHILSEFLPKKDVTIHPVTGGGRGDVKSRTCDLLTLNRELSKELSVVLYEERTFAVHIYEGICTGGAKFLNSGLQRLQYRDSFKTSEFARFGDDQFGFQRIKRLHVQIHPSIDKKNKSNRHDPMLTYFMVIALMDLLKGSGFKALTYLKVEFVEVKKSEYADRPWWTQEMDSKHGDSYWWNKEAGTPRTTSVHGISNVELVLLAFLRIEKVHHFHVVLPVAFDKDTKIQAFISNARRQLDPVVKGPGAFDDDDLEHQLDVSRDALNDWLFELKFGKGTKCPKDFWISLDEFADEECYDPQCDLCRGDQDDENFVGHGIITEEEAFEMFPGPTLEARVKLFDEWKTKIAIKAALDEDRRLGSASRATLDDPFL